MGYGEFFSMSLYYHQSGKKEKIVIREIIEIKEEACVGCGNCVPNCHQGALQIIEGKARLISDLMCEGIGACVGHCPTGAMTVEKREAKAYDEIEVIQKLITQGPKVISAHIEHLRTHNQREYLEQALDYLHHNGFPGPFNPEPENHAFTPHQPKSSSPQGSCPGSAARSFSQWPLQLHLLSPNAPFLRGADLVLAADCTAFSRGDFHQRFLAGKKLAIACPKLDSNQSIYKEKLKAMIQECQLNTLTVIVMEVPCCQSLLTLAQEALEKSSRKIPVKKITIGVEGEILSEQWMGL